MDLESEFSALESVEDNEASAPENLENVLEKPVTERNGACSGVDQVDEKLLADDKSEGVNGTESVNSPPPKVQSSPGVSNSIGSTPQAMKGYGLKKWRRIRREANKEGGSNVDSNKIGKRVLPNSNQNSRNPMPHYAEMKQKSEGSVSSTNAVVKSPGIADDGFYSGLVPGPIFAAGREDSENSEDRSSKSSTEASAPRSRYDIPVGGYAGENNRMRSLNGNNSGNLAVQWGQQGKNRTETSKKPRGEQVKIEKENSHSSMESDSRSSNFVFMQGANSMTSNGRQSRSANYDGENSDEAQGGELGEKLQTGFRKILAEFEDVSQDYLAAELTGESKGENSENHGSSADRDPLVESITTLQSAQEALEKELQKLREIGKVDIFLFKDLVQDSSLPSEFTSVDSRVHDPSSSEPLQYGESQQGFSNLLESEIVRLKQNVIHLESKLEEASSMLEAKEAKITELETTLNSNTSRQEETSGTIELQQGKYQEMETEVEGLFKQKIEAEVEYLAISRTILNLRVAAVDQITFLEEQKTLASEQAQMLNKLEDAGNKASKLKRRAEKLESYCGEIVEADEILKLQKRVCQFTSCFFIQLVLLFIVLGLFVLQLAPHYNGVVPT